MTHDYEPVPSARAARWTSVSEALATQGHDVAVVCHGPTGSSRTSADSPEIHRVEGGWLSRLRSRAAPTMSAPATASGGRGLARAVYDRTWRRLYWPDHAFAWRRPATRRALELQGRRPFDALITVSPPFTSHRVGLEFHRRFPDVPWLADLGDPFSFAPISSPNNPRIYGQRNRRLEEHILGAANVLTTVNEPLRTLWVKHFPSSTTKFHVVPPLAQNIDPAPGPVLPSTKTRKMVYAGTLYKTAGPSPLFRLLERIVDETREEWELHFLGDTWEVRDEIEENRPLLGTRVFFHGTLPRAKAERATREADVLVSLGTRSHIASPSKLFQYFGTGKPVVHVPYMWPDAAAPFLAKYPRSCVITADEATRPGPLPTEFTRFLTLAGTPPKVPSWLEDHSPKRLAETYVALLAEPRTVAPKASSVV